MKKYACSILLTGMALLNCLCLQASDFNLVIRGWGRHGPMDLANIGLKILSEKDRTVMVESFYLYDYYSYPDSLPSIVEHNGLRYTITTLDDDLINNSYMPGINIPASIIHMVGNPFKNLRGEVRVDDSNPAYTSTNGVLMTKDGKRVIHISRNFSGTRIIPEGVDSISEYAAYGMKEIGSIMWEPKDSHCFRLPASLRYIGKDAFAFNLVDSFAIDATNDCFKVIDGVLFNTDVDTLIAYPGRKEGEYSTPSTTLHINDRAFAGSNASNVSLNKGLRSIGEEAFYGNRFTQIVLPGTLTSAGLDFISSPYSMNSLTVRIRPLTTGQVATLKANYGFPPTLTLYVPENEISLYQSDPSWSLFRTIKTYQPNENGDPVDLTEIKTQGLFSIQNMKQGKLSITTERECTIPLYSSNGTMKRTLVLSEGINVIEGLAIGVYILAGNKIVIE